MKISDGSTGLSGLVSFLWRICEGGLSMENLLACFICFRKLFGESVSVGAGEGRYHRFYGI